MEIKEVLEKIALPARSNKNGFYETEKLEAIKTLLEEEGSPFHLIYQNEHTWIFGKNPPERNKFSILVSSHADIVNGITKPFSEFNEETKYFKGTYDNLGTNGACVALMLNEEIPDNVFFAFNDEEETGRCFGAGEALKYVCQTSFRQPFVIALDVTDEGYDNDRLFTLEGMHSHSAATRERVLRAMLSGEGEKQSFEVVRMDSDDNCSMLPDGYVAKGLTVFDESVYYARQNCNSFSFDLPTEGSMHSDSGLYVKEAVMKGYVKSLLQTIYVLDAQYPDRVEELKKEKDDLIGEAKNTPFRKPAYSYSSSYGGSYGSSYQMGYSDYYGSSYGGYGKWSYLHDYDDEDYSDDEEDLSPEMLIKRNKLEAEAESYEDFDAFMDYATEEFDAPSYFTKEDTENFIRRAFYRAHPDYACEMDEEYSEIMLEFNDQIYSMALNYSYDEWDQFYADACDMYFDDMSRYLDEESFDEAITSLFEDAHADMDEEYEKPSKKKKKKDLPKATKPKKNKDDDESYYLHTYKYADDVYERGYYGSEDEKDSDYDDHGL